MATIATELLIIALLVLFNGVLAMSELAVVSARKARLRLRADAGSRGARTALELQDTPNRFLSTVQIGITLVGILAGAFGGATLAEALAGWLDDVPRLGSYSDALALAAVVAGITYLSLVFGELVPKRLAMQHSETLATAVARPMRGLSVAAAPVVWLLGVSTDAILRLIRVRAAGGPAVTEEEIDYLLEEGTRAGAVEAGEHILVTRIFRLTDRRIGELMTPRPRVVWVDRNDPPEIQQQSIMAGHHGYVPVCDGDLDQVLGIVSVRDLWARQVRGAPFALEPLMRPLFVPSSLPVLTLIERLRQTTHRIALVVDEFGGIEGLVTLTDLVEEIVGDLEDAIPLAERAVVQRDSESWSIDGMLSIREVGEVLGVAAFPDEVDTQYQTLAGFLIAHLGRIPRVADTVVWNGVRFEIVDMDGARIDRVIATRLPAAPPAQ